MSSRSRINSQFYSPQLQQDETPSPYSPYTPESYSSPEQSAPSPYSVSPFEKQYIAPSGPRVTESRPGTPSSFKRKSRKRTPRTRRTPSSPYSPISPLYPVQSYSPPEEQKEGEMSNKLFYFLLVITLLVFMYAVASTVVLMKKYKHEDILTMKNQGNSMYRFVIFVYSENGKTLTYVTWGIFAVLFIYLLWNVKKNGKCSSPPVNTPN